MYVGIVCMQVCMHACVGVYDVYDESVLVDTHTLIHTSMGTNLRMSRERMILSAQEVVHVYTRIHIHTYIHT